MQTLEAFLHQPQLASHQFFAASDLVRCLEHAAQTEEIRDEELCEILDLWECCHEEHRS
jgi:hypothetical protein